MPAATVVNRIRMARNRNMLSPVFLGVWSGSMSITIIHANHIVNNFISLSLWCDTAVDSRLVAYPYTFKPASVFFIPNIQTSGRLPPHMVARIVVLQAVHGGSCGAFLHVVSSAVPAPYSADPSYLLHSKYNSQRITRGAPLCMYASDGG